MNAFAGLFIIAVLSLAVLLAVDARLADWAGRGLVAHAHALRKYRQARQACFEAWQAEGR